LADVNAFKVVSDMAEACVVKIHHYWIK